MKIKIVVTKRQNYGRDLFYIENEKDKWLNVIYNQKSLTEYDIKYLKSTGHFEFELKQEALSKYKAK